MSDKPSRKPGWSWPEGDLAPGERRDMAIHATQGFSGQALEIPIHVWRGKEDGPSVFVTAALHGDEINGTGAVREMVLDPGFELKSGCLLLVPVLNVLGFERHSRYLPDRRDLNRSFPGSDSGSMASRFAHRIFEEIILRSDFGIDLHSAAVRRTNYPHIRGDFSNPEVDRLARAFGTEIMVDTLGPKGSMRRAACDVGCPTILLEAGEVWKVEPTVVEVTHRGILSVLRSLNMVEGKAYKPEFRIIAKKTVWLRAEAGGFLRFHAAPGELVEKGQTLATNTSLLGREQSTIVSPMDGVILGMTTLPSVAPGDPVLNIGRLRQPIERIEKKVDNLTQDSLHERIVSDLSSSVMVDDLEDKPDSG